MQGISFHFLKLKYTILNKIKLLVGTGEKIIFDSVSPDEEKGGMKMDWLMALGIVLLVLGFGFAAVEMVIPGFGAPGIIGAICLVAGVFCATDSLLEGIFVTLIVLVVLGLMLAIILWLLSRGKLRSPLILKEEQKKEQGYIGSADLNYLLGKKGNAITDLRPSGAGDFEGVRLDVVSEGGYINKGAGLQIVKVSGSRLVVKEIN